MMLAVILLCVYGARLFILWDGALVNSSPHWGAGGPSRVNVIKMLCAQVKTCLPLKGSWRRL